MSKVTPVGSPIVRNNQDTTGDNPNGPPFPLPSGVAKGDFIVISLNTLVSFIPSDNGFGALQVDITNDAGWMYFSPQVHSHPGGAAAGQYFGPLGCIGPSSGGCNDVWMGRFYDPANFQMPNQPGNSLGFCFTVAAYRNVDPIHPVRNCSPHNMQVTANAIIGAPNQPVVGADPYLKQYMMEFTGTLLNQNNLKMVRTAVYAYITSNDTSRDVQLSGPTPLQIYDSTYEANPSFPASGSMALLAADYQFDSTHDSTNILVADPIDLSQFFTVANGCTLTVFTAQALRGIQVTDSAFFIGKRNIEGTVNLTAGKPVWIATRMSCPTQETDGTKNGYALTLDDGTNPEFGFGWYMNSGNGGANAVVNQTFGTGVDNFYMDPQAGGNFEAGCVTIYQRFTPHITGPHTLRVSGTFNGSMTFPITDTMGFFEMDKIWMSDGPHCPAYRTVHTTGDLAITALQRTTNIDPGPIIWNMNFTVNGGTYYVQYWQTLSIELQAAQAFTSYRALPRPQHGFETAPDMKTVDPMTTNGIGFVNIGMHQNVNYWYEVDSLVFPADLNANLPGIYYAELTIGAATPSADSLDYMDGISVAPLCTTLPDGSMDGQASSQVGTISGFYQGNVSYLRNRSLGNSDWLTGAVTNAALFAPPNVIGVLLDLRTVAQGGANNFGQCTFYRNGTLVRTVTFVTRTSLEAKIRNCAWKIAYWIGNREAYYKNVLNLTGPFSFNPNPLAQPWFTYSPPPLPPTSFLSAKFVAAKVFKPIMIADAKGIKPRVWMPYENNTVRTGR